MLSHLNVEAKGLFLHIVNCSWNSGITPDSWRHAIITPVPKPSKPPEIADSYRPIALTSCLCKAMERMVLNRLNWYLESNNILDNTQSAFRKMRSTTDHIFKLHYDVSKAFEERKSTVAVLVDISKAYDMTWAGGLLHKLYSCGIQGKMFNWLKSFLRNRTFQVRLGNELSDIYPMENGIPQGSSISPVLFTLMMNDLSSCFPEDINLAIFADDVAIWASHRIHFVLEQRINETLEKINTWCWNWGFKLSHSKTTAILFTKRHQIPQISLKLNSHEITFQKQIRYLGITFDSKLTYRQHINNLVVKCKKRLNFMKMISGTKWGAKRELLLLLYRTLIRSVIDYGLPCYGHAKKSSLQKVTTIQNTCLRLALRAFKSTPIAALHVAANELPLSERFRQSIELYIGKILSIPITIKPFSPSDYRVLTNLTELNINTLEHFNTPQWLLHSPEIDCSINSELQNCTTPQEKCNLFYDHVTTNYTEFTHFYTDGSKSNENTTCSFYCSTNNLIRRFILRNGSSVLTAELSAIYFTMLYIQEYGKKQSIIFTDSLAAVSKLNSTKWTNCQLSNNALMLQDQIRKNNFKMIIMWVPSHVGIMGNEIADKEAKSANVENATNIYNQHNFSEYKSLIKSKYLYEWNKKYTDGETAMVFKSLYPCVESYKLDLSKYCKKSQSDIIRLQTGHCLLNKHLFRLKLHHNELCETCLEPETVQHFIMTCNKYKTIRRKLKEVCFKENLQFTLKNVLTNESLIGHTIDYVNETNRNI